MIFVISIYDTCYTYDMIFLKHLWHLFVKFLALRKFIQCLIFFMDYVTFMYHICETHMMTFIYDICDIYLWHLWFFMTFVTLLFAFLGYMIFVKSVIYFLYLWHWFMKFVKPIYDFLYLFIIYNARCLFIGFETFICYNDIFMTFVTFIYNICDFLRNLWHYYLHFWDIWHL